MTDVGEAITWVHREEWARVVATPARRLGDLDIAEEMAAEAFATAVERWPVDGVPASPGAWLITTAHRKAIDRLRREARREEKHREALMLFDTPDPLGAIDDDRLRDVWGAIVLGCAATCWPPTPSPTRRSSEAGPTQMITVAGGWAAGSDLGAHDPPPLRDLPYPREAVSRI
jgi:predicted RNA polymerase sigma factor